MNETAPSTEAGQQRPAPRRGVIRSLWKRLGRRGRNGESSVRETLEELAERHEEDMTPVLPAERILLENILKLRDLTVDDVMVPRADVAAVEIETPVLDVIERIRQTHHSRLPVYKGDLDAVVGMIHVKDILPLARLDDPPPLEQLVRDVLFVVPSTRVLELLLQMRLARRHMALVVDEYGGIDGLVTIEDLVEEIVGEIEDEHDIVEQAEIVPREDGTLIADARVTLEDFEEVVGDVLSEEEREEIDTLGGLVFTHLGRVPSRGEIVVHPSGIEFEVLEGDPRRLKRLRVRNVPQRAEEASAHAGTG